jgi:hypothetical protein
MAESQNNTADAHQLQFTIPAYPPTTQVKQCVKCKIVKHLHEFNACKRGPLGYYHACRSCANAECSARRQRRRQSRQCVTCARPIDGSAKFKYCATCREKARKKKQAIDKERVALAICRHCAKRPREKGSTHCEKCLQVMRARARVMHRTRKEQGLCRYCGDLGTVRFCGPRAKSGRDRACDACYFKSASRRALGDSKYWRSLRQKWVDQDGRCGYTGIKLKMGETASIDHVYPVSRYPELAKDKNNLEWVHDKVNIYKQDLSKLEFISLMKFIVNRFDAA